MKNLTLSELKAQASLFLTIVQNIPIPELYGVNNGKALSNYFENAFDDFLKENFSYEIGNAASGLDFPDLNVDLKVTSARQPQSSSPFRAASQKVYGLGYHLLVFVYDKTDNDDEAAAYFDFQEVVFIDKSRTADYQTTQQIHAILDANGNVDDLDALLQDRNFPLDDIGRRELAERIMKHPPPMGYLTISNALQWRLQYSRVIVEGKNPQVSGIESLL